MGCSLARWFLEDYEQTRAFPSGDPGAHPIQRLSFLHGELDRTAGTVRLSLSDGHN